MAINFDPFSRFNVEPSSFSLPAGMDMNQAAIMNPMMQPVPIFGQQSFSAPRPAPAPEEEEERSFGESLLAGLTFLGTALTRGPRQIVPSSGRPIKPAVRLPQLALPGPTAAAAGASRLGPIGAALGGGYLVGTGLDQVSQYIPGMGGDKFSDKLAGGISNLMGMDVDKDAFTNAGTLAELAEMSAPADRDRDPIRATYQLGPDYGNETIMERESGEIFVPSASQLDAFMDGMEAMSQPTATGIGFGGSEGVAFGGGQPPMTQAETRAMLQERFGAPTISAILDLPSGQGMGMRTDAQGRMISPGDDRTAFDQASQDRIDRINLRDLRPGETLQERDTRIADSRTESEDTATDTDRDMTFEEARKFVPRRQRETVKSYNERIRAFQAQQNSTLNKLKEEYEQYRVSGQNINNARLTALAAKYQQTEPQKYREAVQVAEEMLKNGTLKDEIQAAMYVVDVMGGKSTDIFDPDRPTPIDVDNIPDEAKELLRSDPSLKSFFDTTYGTGAADKVLGN